MQTLEDVIGTRGVSGRSRCVLQAAGVVVLAVCVAALAVLLKESHRSPTPLVMVAPVDQPVRVVPVASEAPPPARADTPGNDLRVRYFNGRPVVPARVIRMRVTAYAPDRRSCGRFADGRTATLHSVRTNGGALVAADPRVLPYGSMLTVPGYDQGRIVPVLDCGSAIKGNRLDVLFPTHEEAMRWGVRDLDVIVWAYADGKPADDPRALR